MSYQTIAAIKDANRARGHHWFDPGALSFFNSRVESGVKGGRFFAHSDRYVPDGDARAADFPRLYRIALATDAGEIVRVDRSWEFSSDRDTALARILGMVGTDLDVRFDPYAAHADILETDADPDHFHWRAFVAGFPVGYRTVRAECYALALEIGAGLSLVGTGNGETVTDWSANR